MQNTAHILLKVIIFIQTVSILKIHIQPDGNTAHEISFVVVGLIVTNQNSSEKHQCHSIQQQ